MPARLAEAVGDEAWLHAMLRAEGALAEAQGELGLLEPQAVGAVADACRARYDLAAALEDGRRTGNPVEPLVRRLRERAPYAHWGATSQDILDTAAALVARDARALLQEDAGGLAAACARLADEHRGTVMAARTLLQQAVPTTFGLKAAGWLAAAVEARSALWAADVPAQLGGAAGTLAAFGPRGLELASLFAEKLELRAPVVPWHASRGAFVGLGAALSLAARAAEKVALDVVLLSQTEVGEVRERAGGGSSTMPHKRNAAGSTLARACATRAKFAAAELVAAPAHEHERAAGAWHAEWEALSDALAYAGGALAWARQVLEGLEVDAARMRANIRAETLSEAEGFGVHAATPEEYLGSADALVDRALALYRET